MLNYQFGTRIVYCGRDPNLSKDFETEIKSANIKDEIINQNAKTLTGAILTTETWFQHNKVIFDSPVFEWNLGNARIKSYSSSSNSDDVLIIKEKPEHCIIHSTYRYCCNYRNKIIRKIIQTKIFRVRI